MLNNLVVEVHQGSCSYQPLANGKSVRFEVELEARLSGRGQVSRRQTSSLRNTNHIRHDVALGGLLSPLLSSIILNELDRELKDRGHKFVRYTDDVVILCRSKQSAQRALKKITRFVESKLFSRENREKSNVSPIRGVKFLGYSFYKVKGEVRLRIHPKSGEEENYFIFLLLD